MKQYITFSFLFILFNNIIAQNHIKNGGFEETNIGKRCSSLIEKSESWKGINTVDLYNRTCSNCKAYLIVSFHPKLKARNGNYFAGIRIKPEYREYIYAKIDIPLEKGKSYMFKMYVRPSIASRYYIKDFGISFVESDPHRKFEIIYRIPILQITLNFMHPYKPDNFINSENDDYIRDSKKWKEIDIPFEATGNENYIIIGYFNKFEDMAEFRSTYDLPNEAYYNIDDISITLKEKTY